MPKAYKLDLQVSSQRKADSQSWHVYGSVNIVVDLLTATHCVVLHAELDTMDVTKVMIADNVGDIVVSTTQHGQLIIRSNALIQPGETTLLLDFNYPLIQGLTGFYLTKYADNEGNDRIIAVTQFEPTYARMALPCFDEPAMKATFDVKITAPSFFSILSNMPISEATDGAELLAGEPHATAVQFKTTPPMSTYLLAWIVGEMASLSTTAPGPKGDRPVTVYGSINRYERSKRGG